MQKSSLGVAEKNEAQRAEKNFLRPPPLSQGVDDQPPPLTKDLDLPLVFTHKQYASAELGSNLSSMRCSVSSPDETLRRELKIQCAAEYFWRTARCFIWWWDTVSNARYYFSNKTILEGEIKDAKLSSFSSDFQTLSNTIKHYFPLHCS